MMHCWKRLAALFGMLCAILLAVPAAAQQQRMAAELLAEGPGMPGETIELALHFTPEPGWHGYWSNPGDAGQGMVLDWDLPAGWEAGEPDYPVPETFVLQGFMNHVYEHEYAVLVPVTIPADAAASGAVPVAVDARWLVCSDVLCVSESGRLETLVRMDGGGARDARFDGWRAAIPPLIDSVASMERTNSALRLAIPLPASLDIAEPHVFLETEGVVDYNATQQFWRDGDRLIAEIPLGRSPTDTDSVEGILQLGPGDGVSFAAAPGEVPAGGTPLAGEAMELAPLWLLLGGALLGGLLLNVMPCVFPILSLKALSLARAGESEAQARREGLAYTGGVILACMALGALLLALRAGGSEIGWAFQLQEPGVVVALLVLAVAITANLAGLFELPALSFSGRGGASGSKGAFATGLLAAFVATPCTGPFMAAAMGAALLLPTPQALLLFAALGLGLALPFLALGFIPRLRGMLPRPGPWMDRFRRIMAIPMGLTALALLWLSWRLGGDGFATIAGLLCIGILIALWVAGQRQRVLRPALVPFAMVAVPFAVVAAFGLPSSYAPRSGGVESILPARPFSEAALAEARASGAPVFAYFTADWCLTCKVNEQVAIERESTRDAFEQAGVTVLVGDWTQRDPEITRFLTARGAAGVPLYLWYAPGEDAEQLPQLLTPDSLIALAEGAPALAANGTR